MIVLGDDRHECRVAVVNPEGHATTTVYDAADRTSALVNAENERSTTTYTPTGPNLAQGNMDRLCPWPPSGTVTDTYKYRAFGPEFSHTGLSDSHLTYVGKQSYYRESEIDLYLAGLRFYDPAIGRWISEDPIGYRAGDENLYRYVHNNPVNNVDPSGLQEGPTLPQLPPNLNDWQKGYFRQVFDKFIAGGDFIKALDELRKGNLVEGLPRIYGFIRTIERAIRGDRPTQTSIRKWARDLLRDQLPEELPEEIKRLILASIEAVIIQDSKPLEDEIKAQLLSKLGAFAAESLRDLDLGKLGLTGLSKEEEQEIKGHLVELIKAVVIGVIQGGSFRLFYGWF